MTEQCKVCGFPHDGDSHSDCIYAQSKEIERLRAKIAELIGEPEELHDTDCVNDRAEIIP